MNVSQTSSESKKKYSPWSIVYAPLSSAIINSNFVFLKNPTSAEFVTSVRRWLSVSIAVLAAGLLFVVYSYFPSALLSDDSSKPGGYLSRDECQKIPDNRKFDCFPRGVASPEKCESRGCCWLPAMKTVNSKQPWCYYPMNFESYRVVQKTSYDRGITLLLNLTANSSYPNDVETLKMKITFETKTRLRIRIEDNNTIRYEPPYPEVPILGSFSANMDYAVQTDDLNFGFAITRKDTGTVIFDTRNIGGLVFSNQFLQLSALIPSKYIYGLGERRNNFALNTEWEEITLFNADNPPQDKINLYGSHAFYLAMEEGGTSHGVFLLNSNAMDIVLQPAPAITYRTIGGILDFYYFLGPSPADVVRQYTEVIGFPFLPPYWSLGFHLCRFGLHSVNDTIEFWSRNKKLGIPFDVQWNDIDYMNKRNDFTIGSNFAGLPEFVKQLHAEGMKYVIILDPGVASKEPRGSYPPYDEGVIRNIFIKNASGLPLEGKVWNECGGTVFPDFTDPDTIGYWLHFTTKLYEQVEYDGIWLDMNEISNFVDGSLYGCDSVNNTLDNPPYVPSVVGGRLNYRTVCMSGKQFVSSHYNVHNLHGFAESMVTSFCLANIRKKRPFVLSRSTFAGSGHYAAHWTGDVFSTWDDMKHSVGDIMSFNMFGIPMVGADICGFNGNTTKQLCQRWSQLGAFYPFSRNHNSDDAMDQDPASFDNDVIESTKKALFMRYKFLPYLYTLFWNAHRYGESVIRPLFFEFPQDENTYTQNTQFLWGPALLVIPVLTENATSVFSYFPKSIWFDAYTLEWHESQHDYIEISAPMDKIPLYLRAGFIVPYQEPSSTTMNSRKNPFGLYVALNEDGRASGSLFWDDGETFEFDENENNLLLFESSGTSLTGLALNWGYNVTMLLDTVYVMGVAGQISEIFVNDRNHTDFIFVSEKRVLTIRNANISMKEPFNVTWMECN